MAFWMTWLAKWMGCLDEMEVVEFALDGMPEGQRQKAEQHLRRCPRCRNQIKAVAALQDGLALRVPQVDPRPELAESIFKNICGCDGKANKSK